jgi:2'-5' RNA ligase
VADLRLFFAARTPGTLREGLDSLTGSLRAPRDGVKWVDAKSIHLTLKFLGATNESLVGPLTEAARSSVRGTGEISLGVGGLGMFPNPKRPRVVWVGLSGDVERLTAVRDALEEACFSLGFPREGRAFRAHLTLGRVKDRISDETLRRIEQNSDVSLGEFVVDGIELIKSDLKPSGAVYTVLSHCPLT